MAALQFAQVFSTPGVPVLPRNNHSDLLSFALENDRGC